MGYLRRPSTQVLSALLRGGMVSPSFVAYGGEGEISSRLQVAERMPGDWHVPDGTDRRLFARASPWRSPLHGRSGGRLLTPTPAPERQAARGGFVGEEV